MAFMSAYKHLDNLCKDINGKGITGYIEDMEQNSAASFQVPGWQDDYKQLKHYRWVRNQIAHEDYADEENMCTPGDTEWLENFYNRIMTQTDPVAQYRKKNIPCAVSHAVPSTPYKKESIPCTALYTDSYDYGEGCQNAVRKQKKRNASRVVACIMLVLAIVFSVFAWNHPELSWPWENKVTYVIYGVYTVIMLALFIIPRQK